MNAENGRNQQRRRDEIAVAEFAHVQKRQQQRQHRRELELV